MTQVSEKITPSQAWLLIAALFFSLANPSLPAMSGFYITGDFGAGIKTVSWGTAFSLLGVVITKPLGIILARKIGRYRLFKGCICISFLTNIIILATSSYYFYLLIWFIHGLATGPMYLNVVTSIRAYGPAEKISSYTQFILSSLIVAPIIGAAFGAIIAYQFHWKIAFLIFSLIYIIIIFYLFTQFKDIDLPKENLPIDWATYTFYALGFLFLGFCLTTGLVIDGFRSFVFNISFIIGLISMTYFLVRNHYSESPIINWKATENTAMVTIIVTLTLFIFIFYYASIVMISHWLHLYVNYSLNWINWLLLLNLIGPITLHYVFQFNESLKIHLTVIFSTLIIIFVSIKVSHFNVDVNMGRIILVRLLEGFATSLFLPAAIKKVITGCKKKMDHWGIAMYSTSKSIGSFVGIALFGIIWDKRSTFYHSRLGGTLTTSSENTTQVLKHLNIFNFSNSMKLEGLNAALTKQSKALALSDCFFLIAIAMGVLLSIYLAYILFYRKKELTAEKTI